MIAVRFGRRAGWGIADQTASSLTNFALGIAVASQTSTASFGAFSIAFVTYLLILNVGRAMVSLPLMIRYSGESDERWGQGASAAVGVAVIVGCMAAALLVPVGLVIGGEVGIALVGFGVGLPGLIVQDSWRFCFFAAGRDRSAFVNDMVWVAVLIPTFATLIALRIDTPLPFILAWGFAATMAAIGGFLQARLPPNVAATRRWLTDHADLIPRFIGETMARMGSTQLTTYVIGLIGGLATVGTIRAGELILGPFNILFQGVHLVALPEAARLLKESDLSLLRWSRLLSGFMMVAAGLFGLACLAIPASIGELVLGASWEPARAILVLLIAALIGMVAGAGAGVGLRALGEAGRLLRATLLMSIATLLAALAGVAIADATGAAVGLGIGAWVGAGCTWLELLGAMRSRQRAPVEAVRDA